VYADQRIITDDGREALLKEDGTWVFRSTDRFATTKEGRRVRLKGDGSWEYTTNKAMTSKAHARTTELDIKLQKVVIETYTRKIQKNKRVKTQTVLYLDITLSHLAQGDIAINKSDTSLVEVKDNQGTNYTVLSIQPAPATIKPDSQLTLVIRIEKSPSVLDNVKTMDFVLKPGIFGISEPVRFSQKVIDFDEKNVDGFESNK
jgi:hypothetical protein